MREKKDSGLGVRLPKSLREQIDRIATAQDRSMSSVVRLALKNYLTGKAKSK